MGSNGSGKSTLLKLAAGVEPPDAGRVLVDGLDLWRAEEAARRSLAYVPEQADLTPYAAIRDILALVARLRGEPPRAAAEALAAAGLQGLGGRSIRELSLGQKRRATFAAAFIGRPAHLLLDEPLDAMDRTMRGTILAWLGRRLAEGASAVLVSHETDPFNDLVFRTLDMERIGPPRRPNLCGPSQV
jgi:ABC-type multidrug transport system ATPase subunit